MKITQQQSEQILELIDLDQQIKQLSLQIRSISSGEQQASFRDEFTQISSELLTARNALEATQIDLKRAEADLLTVEQRIARDQERLNSSSSARDIQGIESELTTLSKRKSELEDSELALMETLEELQSALDAVSERHNAVKNKLSEMETQAENSLAELRSKFDNASNLRKKSISALPEELASTYERKAAKGAAAGRLLGGECGACRMQIGAIDLDALIKAPADEVVNCPECQAILVRN